MKDYLKQYLSAYMSLICYSEKRSVSAKNSHYMGLEKLRGTGGAQLLGPVFKYFVDVSLKKYVFHH